MHQALMYRIFLSMPFFHVFLLYVPGVGQLQTILLEVEMAERFKEKNKQNCCAVVSPRTVVPAVVQF